MIEDLWEIFLKVFSFFIGQNDFGPILTASMTNDCKRYHKADKLVADFIVSFQSYAWKPKKGTYEKQENLFTYSALCVGYDRL